MIDLLIYLLFYNNNKKILFVGAAFLSLPNWL